MRHPRTAGHAPTEETPVEEWTEARTGTPPHVAPDPVDVRVIAPVHVEEYPAQTTIAYRTTVGTLAVQLAPKLRTRTALHIRPVGGAIFLANVPAVTAGTGYTLPDGQAIRIESTDALYAIAAANVDVSILAEVREG